MSEETTKNSTVDEKLDRILIELSDLRQQLVRIEDDSKARYVDLRTHIVKVQTSMDVLNEKFDAQVNEVKFLRKSVRALEDKADQITN